mgnify:FL=1
MALCNTGDAKRQSDKSRVLTLGSISGILSTVGPHLTIEAGITQSQPVGQAAYAAAGSTNRTKANMLVR